MAPFHFLFHGFRTNFPARLKYIFSILVGQKLHTHNSTTSSLSYFIIPHFRNMVNVESSSRGPAAKFLFGFFDTTFSTYPEGSKGVIAFPDGCLHPGSHLFEVPEREWCKGFGLGKSAAAH